MDEHTALRHAFFNERYRGRKVPDQLLVTSVRNRYDLILQVFGEEGLDAVGHLEDVGDIGVLEGLQV